MQKSFATFLNGKNCVHSVFLLSCFPFHILPPDPILNLHIEKSKDGTFKKVAFMTIEIFIWLGDIINDSTVETELMVIGKNLRFLWSTKVVTGLYRQV